MADQGQIADILFPVAVEGEYSYVAPPDLRLAVGDFVDAPLGARLATGVVWALREGAGDNLKPARARCAIPPLPEKLRLFLDWLARWTLTPRGMALRLATRAPFAQEPEPVRMGLRLAGPAPARMTPARARAIAAAGDGALHVKSALAELAQCSAAVLDGLVVAGTLEAVALAPEPIALPPDPDFRATRFEPDQSQAAQALSQAVAARKFSVALLEGVTGSGKTEVYFEAVAQALREGGQALILLPEIALTTQFLERFSARFGVRPAAWHSGVPPRRRARLWSAVALGEVKVVAGARSALFLPFSNLRAIVVDEEHEGAYKQEDGVLYHARDMAVVRGRIEGAAVVLASATPSIETRVNASQGRYRHVILRSRYAARPMPDLAAIDMRASAPPKGQWLSPRLVGEVARALERGEQALLFLNRRGYAPLTLCKQCGHRFQCPNCSAWLVEHRFRRALACHHCGHVERRPDACPECEASDCLAACGPGVERLAEEARALFPDKRLLTLSSDFPGGAERMRAELEAVARGECDLVVGTQLVAKGHHFPHLTLVGVVDADVGLASGDPRAAERTFQLLQQVTGRAGRGERPGRGLMQTYQPDHPVIRALLSGDAERFYEQETQSRRASGLPPFGRLAGLIVQGGDAGATLAHARALARAAQSLPPADRWRVAPIGGLPGDDEIVVLGPAEAPLALLRGKHRYRLLVKAPRGADLQGFLRAALAAAPPERGGVRVVVDVDPQSFL